WARSPGTTRRGGRVLDAAEHLSALAAVHRVPRRADAGSPGAVATGLVPEPRVAAARIVVVPRGHRLAAGVADQERVRERDLDVGAGVGSGRHQFSSGS